MVRPGSDRGCGPAADPRIRPPVFRGSSFGSVPRRPVPPRRWHEETGNGEARGTEAIHSEVAEGSEATISETGNPAACRVARSSTRRTSVMAKSKFRYKVEYQFRGQTRYGIVSSQKSKKPGHVIVE